MAKKKDNDLVEPPYTLLTATSMKAISELYPCHEYNSEGSRSGMVGIQDLLGFKVDKDNKVSVNAETTDVLVSMNERGWERVDKFVTTTCGTNTQERKVSIKLLKAQRKADLKELATLQLWKGDHGRYSYQGKDVDITLDDYIAEWVRTFPEKIGKVDRFEHKSFEPVLAGNRGLTLLILHNTIVRKAGFPQNVVTHIEREQRGYATAEKRNDNSTFLNEIGKLGKLESSPRQKQGVAFRLRENGRSEKDLELVLAVKKGGRGRSQAYWALSALMFLVRFAKEILFGEKTMTGIAVYTDLKTQALKGEIPLVKQGKQLKAIQQRRNMFGHSDGLTEAFKKAGPEEKRGAYGARTSTKLNPATQKEFIRSNPKETAQVIVDYFVSRKDKDWNDPMIEKGASDVSSMSSTEITNVAANCSGLVEVLLNTCGGIETGAALSDTAKTLSDYGPKLYPENKDGIIPKSEALKQSDIADMCKRIRDLEAKVAKKSGRRSRTG